MYIVVCGAFFAAFCYSRLQAVRVVTLVCHRVYDTWFEGARVRGCTFLATRVCKESGWCLFITAVCMTLGGRGQFRDVFGLTMAQRLCADLFGVTPSVVPCLLCSSLCASPCGSDCLSAQAPLGSWECVLVFIAVLIYSQAVCTKALSSRRLQTCRDRARPTRWRSSSCRVLRTAPSSQPADGFRRRWRSLAPAGPNRPQVPKAMGINPHPADLQTAVYFSSLAASLRRRKERHRSRVTSADRSETCQPCEIVKSTAVSFPS